ncbi:MAG: hypothetical protein V1745_02980 [Patescibacteria group bacterium]
MIDKPLVFKTALGLLGLTMFTLAIIVAVKFRASTVEQQPVTTEAPAQTTTTQTAPTERAFIRIKDAPTTATRGTAWTATFTSNAWSKCLADLYKPDGEPLVIDKEAAKATGTGDGSFSWTWNMPADAVTGSWVVRLMCGSPENLWTSDVTVEIRE